jgi:hypothetical protein
MKIVIDDENRIITIAGVPYSFGLFAAWAESGIEVNVPFAITKREEDGTVIVERLTEESAAAMFIELSHRAGGMSPPDTQRHGLAR